ncbi:hypothetical protein Ancab_016705 [Ancistrocladus abbreviatus]
MLFCSTAFGQTRMLLKIWDWGSENREGRPSRFSVPQLIPRLWIQEVHHQENRSFSRMRGTRRKKMSKSSAEIEVLAHLLNQSGRFSNVRLPSLIHVCPYSKDPEVKVGGAASGSMMVVTSAGASMDSSSTT